MAGMKKGDQRERCFGQSLSRAGGFGIANQIIADLSQDGTVCASKSGSGKTQDSAGTWLRFPNGGPISLEGGLRMEIRNNAEALKTSLGVSSSESAKGIK